jgi:myo-inositol 2-dehydrogenase / D-chiro-inositol 1-dehydrogenase
MSENTSRREFLKTSSLLTAGAAITAGLDIPLRVHAAGSDLIKVGLIGCGGRGTGAVLDCINAGGNVKIVAVADAFEEKAKRAAAEITKRFSDKADLPADRIFWGLDAYLKVLDTNVDMVIIAGPPGFRPQHYEAAVKAGKHVFMEKPVCVCPGGFRKVMATNKVAEEKNLKVVVGLQRHHQANYQSGIQAIREGKYGDITLLRAYWNGGGIWNRPRRPITTEMQYQINNWYHFAWLSGDQICEQHVHNLDIANWIMTAVLKKEGADWAHPIEANGMGACLTRGYNGKDVQGQIFDAHFIEFVYPNGVRLLSQCRHQPNTWSVVNEYFHATGLPQGRTVAGGGPEIKLQFPNGMVQEHYDLQQAIREDQKHNEGWYGAVSSMTAVLGRMATYSGLVVKWDDLIKNGPDTFPEQLSWDANPPVMPDANGFYPIPMPGKYNPYARS